MKIPDILRAHVWWLALAGALAAVLGVTLPWTRNSPPEPLVTVFSWSCFLAASGLLAVLALRRRQLLRDRPSIALALLLVCGFLALLLWHPRPGHGIAELYFYVLVAGAFHLLTFLLLALLLAPVSFVRSPERYLSLLERIGLFSALLLLSGAFLNVAWMRLVYDRFYYSQDTVVDWFAFIPFGQWVLDMKWGDETGALLRGAELWHLQGLWLLFAVLAWGTAALGYRRIVRLLAPLVPGAAPLATDVSPL